LDLLSTIKIFIASLEKKIFGKKKEKRCNKHLILIRMVKQRTNDFYEKEQSEFENTQDITGKVSSKHQSINQLSLNSMTLARAFSTWINCSLSSL
jgi:hypothetical protein